MTTTKPKALTPEGVDRAHLTCRAPYNHDWHEDGSTHGPEGFMLRMRCSKCESTFKQLIGHGGDIQTGRSYVQPKDYRDTEGWTRTDWRLNFLLGLEKKAKRR